MSKHNALATKHLPERDIARMSMDGSTYKLRCDAATVEVYGVLTTDHSASSYGMPVFVDCNGEVIGPTDDYTIALKMDVEHMGDDVGNQLLAAAQRTGYRRAP